MHYLPPTPSGFLQWFRRLHRTLLLASGDLGRNYLARVVNFGQLSPEQLALVALECLLPVRIVTHTWTRSAHNNTPLRKTLWDNVYLRDTILGRRQILRSGHRSTAFKGRRIFCQIDSTAPDLPAVSQAVVAPSVLLQVWSCQMIQPLWLQSLFSCSCPRGRCHVLLCIC